MAQRLHATPSWDAFMGAFARRAVQHAERRRGGNSVMSGSGRCESSQQEPAYRSYNAGRPSRLSTWHIWSAGALAALG